MADDNKNKGDSSKSDGNPPKNPFADPGDVKHDKKEEPQPVNPFLKDEAPKKNVKKAPDVKKVEPKTAGDNATVEVVNTSAAADPALEDFDEFKEGIWDILGQAGLTKGRVIGFLIILVVVILGLFLFVFNGDSSDGEKEVERPVEQEDLGVVPSTLIGEGNGESLRKFGDTAGVGSTLFFGQTDETDQVKYIRYMSLIRQLDNIARTDVYALLDLSTDRRGALNSHLEEMNNLIVQAQKASNEIDQLLLILDGEHELLVDEIDFLESQFFVEANSLLGQQSFETLEDFTVRTKRADQIKAFYNAYALVGDMLSEYLFFLRPRYEDIKANEEAVIRGIRVFDIENSDIDAIINLPRE